jgi:putative transcriptional regulator
MRSNLKSIRTNKGFTQEELAQKVGISRQSIYAIESGKFNPSILLALKIAYVLETSLYDLFELDNTDWE